MLDALTASGYLDGLKRRLQRQWDGSLPPSEVDDCIAEAVDSACDAVFNGRCIRDLRAWLWKTARNTADDKWRFDYSRRATSDDGTMLGSVEADETLPERARLREMAEVRRKEAIRIARDLLPRIGDGQVRDVMEIFIDAAGNGLPDLPASSIAEDLGISNNAVRTLISRGLRRLRREAEREGFEMPTELPETDTGHEEQEQ